ncbi:helix-turn-helix domain-containing protein [Streptomyces sp. NPDC093097]|uniref:helix-turn-helix domain-containing protein n=1 Tax=Streptomyces sp. NPDC093097 TaxID=3366027 RepID=UPI003806ABC4
MSDESAGPTGSTVPRRQLGRHLTELRERAGLTAKAAAKELERSTATLWRIESGKTSTRSHEVELMCRVYEAPPDLTKALTALAKETKARGWWHAYGDVIPEGFDLYIGLEEAASQLDVYEATLVPGLLQTGEYAHQIIAAGHSDRDPAEIERRVQLRVKRRSLITRVINPPALSVVLYEAVLRCPVGGRKTMAGQLRHVVDVSRLPNATVRVVPFAAGLHEGVMSGQFTILRFPTVGGGKTAEPPTVFADGYTGDLYLDRPSEVEQYDMAFRNISSMALSEEDSRRLILETAGQYGQG